VLPDGKSYFLLVLPPQGTIRPELLAKILELVEKGATISGPKPLHSPSMENYPEADKEVQRLTASLQDIANGKTTDGDKTGNGIVFYDKNMEKILTKISLEPDVNCQDSTILWTHRHMEDIDIYFLSNQEMKAKTVSLSFRIEDRVPEVWFPDNGERILPIHYEVVNNRTEVTLKLNPAGSVFVVFVEQSDLSHKMESINTEERSVTIDLDNPWEVHFPDGWDVPDTILFDSLFSWTTHPHEGIKYFSGTASYFNSFQLERDLRHSSQKIFLDLGEVQMMAEVIVNGENLGVLWKYPYQVDISDYIQPGKNQLEIRITNTWWNRLIGDAKYPEGFPGSDYHKSRTFTTVKAWNADDELMPAGLLGPVRILLHEAGS
jgi:hypothetical protein